MLQPTKIFRVFVSSTFSDFKYERDALQYYVFPKLKAFSRTFGFRFQAFDLRWGISSEAALDQQTVRICIEELKRCQNTLIKPNFIALLGDRYGWRPLPEQIPGDEFNKLRGSLSGKAGEALMTQWYKCDENSPVPQYILQPRTGRFIDHSAWAAEVEHPLLVCLEKAAIEAGLTEKEIEKYLTSATHKEIQKGILETEYATDQSFAFLRCIENFDALKRDHSHPAAVNFIDMDSYGQLDDRAHQAIDTLKKTLKSVLNENNIYDYSAIWTGNDIRINEIGNLPLNLSDCVDMLNADRAPGNFCEAVWLKLARSIQNECKKFSYQDPGREMEQINSAFRQNRLHGFSGQEPILDKIQDYIAREDKQVLGIIGSSGSGKSAVMSKAVQWVKEQGRKGDPISYFVVDRFLGISPMSASVGDLVAGMCRQIIREFHGVDFSAPSDFSLLITEFKKCLSMTKRNVRLIVFLDGLDQLLPSDNAHLLQWLPDELPSDRVKIIVSTLKDHKTSFSALTHKLPESNLVELSPMDTADADHAIACWEKSAERILQTAQRSHVLERFNCCRTPLFLKFAFEEAKRWKSYDKIPEYDSRNGLAAEVDGIISNLFWRLCRPENHGRLLVEKCLQYLVASRNGLSEDEVVSLLSADHSFFNEFKRKSFHPITGDRLPVMAWSRLFSDLEPYLMIYQLDNSPLLGFFHRHLREWVRTHHYDTTIEDKRTIHKALADYFALQPIWHSPGKQNFRLLSELPYHLLKSGQWEKLGTLYRSPPFLEAIVSGGRLPQLLTDLSDSMKILPDESPVKVTVRFLYDALYRHRGFISEYPDTVFQTLWNTARPLSPTCRVPEAIIEMLSEWLAEKQKNRLDFSWIRSITDDTSESHLTELPVSQGVKTMAVSADGELIAYTTDQFELCLVECSNGNIIWQQKAASSEIWSVAISENKQYVASASNDSHVKIWHIPTGVVTGVIKGLSGSALSVAFSPDGRTLTCGSSNAQLIVCDISGWKVGERNLIHAVEKGSKSSSLLKKAMMKLRSTDSSRKQECMIRIDAAEENIAFWNEYKEREQQDQLSFHALDLSVTSICFSKDGARILVSMTDGTARIFDRETLSQLQYLIKPKDINSVVPVYMDPTFSGIDRYRTQKSLFMPDENAIACLYRDGSCAIYSLQTQEVKKEHFQDGPTHFIVLPDGRVISGSKEGKFYIWEPQDNYSIVSIQAHDGKITGLSASRDGRRLFSASGSGVIRVWEASALNEEDGHEQVINSMAFFDDGQKIASFSKKEVFIWESATGILLKKVKLINYHDRPFVCNNDVYILTCDFSSKMAVYHIEKEAVLCEIKEKGKPVAVSSGGRLFAAEVTNQPNLAVYQTLTGQCLGSLTLDSTAQKTAAFSNDDKLIVAAEREGIRIWDAVTLEPVITLERINYMVYGLCFSRDNRLISGICSGSHKVYVWEMKNGKIISAFKDNGKPVKVLFTNDNQYLLVQWPEYIKMYAMASVRSLSAKLDMQGKGMAEDTLEKKASDLISMKKPDTLWDVKRGTCWNVLPGHDGQVLDVDISCDNQHIVSGGVDGTVRIWSPDKRHSLAVFQHHKVPVKCAAFSPDGTRVGSADAEGNVVVWTFKKGNDGTHFFSAIKNLFSSNSQAKAQPQMRQFTAEGIKVQSLCWNNPENLIMAAGQGEALAWDLKSGQKAFHIKTDNLFSDCLAVSPDGNIVSFCTLRPSAGNQNTGNKPSAMSRGFMRFTTGIAGGFPAMVVYDIRKDRALYTTPVGSADSQIIHQSFSSDGKKIRLFNTDNTLMVLDAPTGKLLFQETFLTPRTYRPGMSSQVYNETFQTIDAVITRDGTKIVSGGLLSRNKGYFGTNFSYVIRVIDIRSRQVVSSGVFAMGHAYQDNRRDYYSGYHVALAVAEDNSFFVTGSHESYIGVWDCGTQYRVLNGTGDLVDIAADPDQSRTHALCRSGAVEFYGSKRAEILARYPYAATQIVKHPNDDRYVCSNGGKLSIITLEK